jgi:hypothetical protein
MGSASEDLSIAGVRAAALFASALQRSDQPSGAQIRQAIAMAMQALGERGCAASVAQAYGEHPETAVMRMRWARAAAAGAFGTEAAEPAYAGSGQGARHLARRAA